MTNVKMFLNEETYLVILKHVFVML